MTNRQLQQQQPLFLSSFGWLLLPACLIRRRRANASSSSSVFSARSRGVLLGRIPGYPTSDFQNSLPPCDET